MFVLYDILFIKYAYAGTGSANDVTYLFLLIILFLALLLAIAYAYRAIVNYFTHHLKNGNPDDDISSENGIQYTSENNFPEPF